MDDRTAVIDQATLDAIRPGEPAEMAKVLQTRGSTSRETAVGILAEVIAVRRREG